MEKEKNVLKNVGNKGGKFFGEFRTFLLRGNVLDLAVGVLIGAAFQGLVASLTNNIISPILGSFSKVDFRQFTLNIGNLHLSYGAFITDVINFIIMAFVIFLIVKFMNALSNVGKKKEDEKKEDSTPIKTDETVLLEEIRDLLKESKKTTKK